MFLLVETDGVPVHRRIKFGISMCIRDSGMVAAFLVAVLTPIFTFIAYAVKPTPPTWWFSLLSIIIAALPVLIALCVWKWAYSKDHKYGWSYMLAIYQEMCIRDRSTVVYYCLIQMNIINLGILAHIDAGKTSVKIGRAHV